MGSRREGLGLYCSGIVELEWGMEDIVMKKVGAREGSHGGEVRFLSVAHFRHFFVNYLM